MEQDMALSWVPPNPSVADQITGQREKTAELLAEQAKQFPGPLDPTQAVVSDGQEVISDDGLFVITLSVDNYGVTTATIAEAPEPPGPEDLGD